MDEEAREFGQYRLESLIGCGGMGEVYQAFDTRHDRVVALKFLPEIYSRDGDYQRRFRRESHVAARLREPHVIPIHDYGDIDGRLFIDMRLVDGGRNIGTILHDEGPMDPQRVVNLIGQVAEALDAAHEDGLIHRDVKPSNVLVTATDFVYVVDFGIAHTIGRAATSLTMSGTTVGTLDYMAPERFGGAEIDRRVDVYSLSCVLYECLTGCQPFSGSDLPALMYAHLHKAPPKPSAANAGVPVQFDAVIAHGMAKDPEDRIATAGALAAEARAALAAATEEAGPGPVTRRVGGPPPVLPPRAGPRGGAESRGAAAVGTGIGADAGVGAGAGADAGSGSTGTGVRPGTGARTGLSRGDAATAPPTQATPAPWMSRTESPPVVGPPSPPPPRPPSLSGAAPPPSDVAREAEPHGAPRPRRLRLVVIGVVVVVGVLVAAAVGYLALTGSVLRPEAGRGPGAGVPVSPSVAMPTVRTSVPVGPSPGSIQVAPGGRSAYVANWDTGTVTVLDTGANRVSATIPLLAGTPQFTAFTPDGRRAYVSIVNQKGPSTVAVIDTASKAVLTTIPVDPQPFALAASPDQRSVWVPDHDSSVIDIIDTSTNTVVRRIQVAPNPHSVAFSADGRRAYTADHQSNVVSVIDTASFSVLTTIPVGTSPHSVAVSPDGTRVAVACYDANQVDIIDTASDRVVATIPVSPNPRSIRYAPDGRHIYAANESGSVSVISATGNAVTATIPLGGVPSSVGVLPDGRQAYVTNLGAGNVTVLNTAG